MITADDCLCASLSLQAYTLYLKVIALLFYANVSCDQQLQLAEAVCILIALDEGLGYEAYTAVLIDPGGRDTIEWFFTVVER